MGIHTRKGRVDEHDIGVVVHHRTAMFFDMGHVDQQVLETMAERFRGWLRKKMNDREYHSWFAVDEHERVIAGAGLWLMEWPPHVIAGGKWRGNILNVYTEPEYRRKGLARGLMNFALDWCEKEGVESVILHASEQGKALYESMGFEATNEMRLKQRLR